MALVKIPIISSVSARGIIKYTIDHDIGALYATCNVEMLSTNALLIGDELILENEVFKIISLQKKPHKRGVPRTVILNGRSKADVFEQITLDNDVSYQSWAGSNRDVTLYDGFDSLGEAKEYNPDCYQNGIFKGTITKAKKAGCLGEDGWTAHEIMKDLVEYTEIAKVEITCMDYDILRVDFNAGTSVVSAANQLFGMFKPFIYAQAQVIEDEEGQKTEPTLFIIPTSDPQPYDWPDGNKIDQDIRETKIDNITNMVIIIGGSDYDPSVPNPCDPGCPEVDVDAILNDINSVGGID